MKNFFMNLLGRLKPRAKFSWILSVTIWVFILIYVGFGVYFGLQIYKDKKYSKQIRLATNFYPFPAAMVNGKIIWAKAYYKNYSYIKNSNEKSQKAPIDEKKLNQDIINLLAENEIIQFQALRYNIRVSNKELNDAYTQTVAQAGNKEDLNKVLINMFDMTEGEFKQLVKDVVLKEKVRNEVIAQVKVVHIFVKDEARAKDIVARLNKGENFADLAKQFSEDTKSRDSGGDIGWLARGQLVIDNNPIPEFDDAAFKAKIGELVGPVKIAAGYEIFKVEARKGTVNESFDKWLSDLKSKAKIWRFIK